MIADKIADYLKLRLRYGDRYSFLRQLNAGAKILDVGCANGSASKIRAVVPECDYTGIDVFRDESYRDGEKERFIIAEPEAFDLAISELGRVFDAVISSHNLEHCNDRDKTLSALLDGVVYGGQIFFRFPSEKSVDLPSRGGTLNYYDDETHVGDPPNYAGVLETLRERGFEIEFAKPHFQPLIDRVRGFLNEPRSRRENRLMAGTWAYHGFESIIWARNSTP